LKNESSNDLSINMINIFHQMNNTKKTIIKKIKEELCHEREHIIMTNINHHIKKFEQINIADLHDLVSKSISMFEVDEDIYANILFKMKQKEYIDINNNKVRKIVYE